MAPTTSSHLAPTPSPVAPASYKPRVRIFGVNSWPGMPVRTLKAGSPEPEKSPSSELLMSDLSEENEEINIPDTVPEGTVEPQPDPVPDRDRLKTLRPNRVSDSDWSSSRSIMSDTDTDYAPGGPRSRIAAGGRRAARGRAAAAAADQGRRGARGRGAGRPGGHPGVRGRGAGLAFGSNSRPNDESCRVPVPSSPSLQGPDEENAHLAAPSDVDNTDNDTDEEQTVNIRAWEESENETSATHSELMEISEDDMSLEFSSDESDDTIQRNYKESVENQKYRVKIMARNLFKKKVLTNNGFHQADDEAINNNQAGPRKRRRNANFRDLLLRRRQQKLAAVEKIFGNDDDMKIAFAKRILKKAGIKYEEGEEDLTEKNKMLALSAQAKNKLTRKTYESLRFSNLAMCGVSWPSWIELLKERKKCCPEEDMEVDQEGAFYKMRDVILHTLKR